jgi:hypothetical protein
MSDSLFTRNSLRSTRYQNAPGTTVEMEHHTGVTCVSWTGLPGVSEADAVVWNLAVATD